jgi:preprotein translocase subunit SecF
MSLESFYEKHYKKLMFISYAILLFSILFVSYKYVTTGDVIERDITLKGGVSATIYNENLNLEEIKSYLKDNVKDFSVRGLTDLNTGKQTGLIIEVAEISEPELRELLSKKMINVNFNNKEEYDPSITSAQFGETFYRGLLLALLFSFIFMSIVVFISFRTFIPSIAVISAALTDMLAGVVVIDLLGIKLSASGMVAFLLVIGYSIDTDILLTTRLLKRREDGLFYERLKHSIITGLTMTIAAIVALSVSYFVSIPLELKQIFLIIVICLFFDIIATWGGNAGILIHYCKKKNIT